MGTDTNKTQVMPQSMHGRRMSIIIIIIIIIIMPPPPFRTQIKIRLCRARWYFLVSLSFLGFLFVSLARSVCVLLVVAVEAQRSARRMVRTGKTKEKNSQRATPSDALMLPTIVAKQRRKKKVRPTAAVAGCRRDNNKTKSGAPQGQDRRPKREGTHRPTASRCDG